MHSLTPPDSALSSHAWRSVAAPLLEHLTDPAAVLDADDRVQLVNAALLKLLGHEEGEVVGQPWAEILGPERRRQTCPFSKGEKERSPCECTAVRRGDRYLWLTIEYAPLDPGSPAVRLARVTGVRAGAAARESTSVVDLRYSIAWSDGARFALLDKALSRPAVCARLMPTNAPGQPCYAALFGRADQCPSCPVEQLDDGRQTVTAVFEIEGPLDGFGLVTASRVSEGRVDVDSRIISEELLSTLLRARIDSIAERCSLSAREREVLNLLLLGRTLADIALVLSITTRTVRFHQANLFTKLGADSRLDLVRVIVL